MLGIHPFVDSLFRSLYFILSLVFVLHLIRVHNPRRKYVVLRTASVSILSIVFVSFIRWGFLELAKLFDNNAFLSNTLNVVYFSLCVACAFASLLFIFDVSVRKSLFLVTISCLIEHLSRNVFAMITFFVPRQAMSIMYRSYFGYMGFNLLFVFLFAFLFWYIVLRKQLKKFDYDETLQDNRYVLISIVNLFVCVGVSSFTSFTLSGAANQFTVLVICPIYAILCCFLGLYLQINIVSSNKLKNDKKTLDILIKRESQKNAAFSENVEALQIEIHDLKKRLNRLEEVGGDSEEKANILKDFNSVLDKYNNFVKTGNSAIDSLLANKYLLAAKEEIDFTYFVDGNVLNFIETDDVIALFDNVLSNAFEAAINEEKANRVIHLQISKEKQMAMVVVRNYSSKKPQFVNGLPVTSKDKTYHGFGVKSIRRIVKKYNGEVNFNYNNNFFTCRIFFPRIEENNQ